MSTTTQDPYPASAAFDTTSNPPGRISLVVAIVVVVVSLIQQVVSYSLPLIMASAGIDYGAIRWIFGVFGFIQGILAIIAIAFGIVGLRRFGSPRAAAGAGTAVGVTTLLSVVIGLVMPFVLSALP